MASETMGMNPENVEATARQIGNYTDSLESIAGDVSQAGWASRSPSLFDLIPGSSLVMTAGSVLLAESAAADVRAAVASAYELLGRLTQQVADQRYVSSADDGSYVLGFINSGSAQAMYEEMLKDPGALDELTPSQVAAFWKYLSQDQSDTLWQTYPRLIGNKSGVPFDVRINANRLNAIEDLDAGVFSSPEHQAYLEAMRDGDIQLVTYDPANHRFVEALNLGVWNEATERFDARTAPVTEVITYVPGTFTTDQSVYAGDARAIPSWLAENHADAVVFIYKDGIFAGGLNGQGDFLTGINQANDKEFARETGQTLYEFDRDIGLNTMFVGAEQTAIGHSWGLANIANSEVSGAHYDNVISLAGAWVPEEWIPDSDTEYSHHSYTDWLSVLQDQGLVGDGRNPDVTPAFANHQYQGPNDAQLGYDPVAGTVGGLVGGLTGPFGTGVGNLVGGYGDDIPILIDNHDLVASTRTGENGQMENADVLVAIEKEIFL